MNESSIHIALPIYPPSARFEVEARLGEVEFACDLSVCKGACCTMPGGRGAPILESEIQELKRVFPEVKKYLPEAALQTIEDEGIWKCEIDGTFSIPTIGGKECIFVRWEGDIALCGVQAAFQNGDIIGFEKPISCHLFPIRIYPEVEDDSYYILYEEITECEGGRARGEKERIPLLDFLELPIARALGKERREMLMKSFVKD